MRMTNKIMQNNSLYNINNNKELQDKLSTQMSTKKKLTRPSDDPVVAIRALRLRSDVSQITQFYEKNAKDAESWLKVTGDVLETTSSIIESMVGLCGQGANKDLGPDKLEIVLAQLKELKNEFYSTGNVDYAGRYMFTGYRTDTPLTYTEDIPNDPANPSYQNFSITEQVDISALDSINHTIIGGLKGLTKENYDPTVNYNPAVPNSGEKETNIVNGDIYRIRISYSDVKSDVVPTITTVAPPTVPPTIPPAETALFTVDQNMSSTADPNPYDYILKNPDKSVFVPETGEILIGADVYKNMNLGSIDSSTEIRINYQKDSWEKGDMRPQHYFACENITDPANTIKYNYAENPGKIPPQYIPSDKVTQYLEYDVGYNQKIRVNTTAGEVFTMDMDRNIDDMEEALSKLKEIYKVKDDLDKKLDGMEEGEAGYANLQATYAAADKAYTYIRDNMQKMFEGLITKVNDIGNMTNLAITDNGTRSSRLDLIDNRLMTQKTTFETLQSANEDIDVTEVTVQLTSMGYSYQSALMATSKILQNSLMNYI